MEVEVARAGDAIAEAPTANASAAASGAGDAGRANINATSDEGTAAAAASEVTVLLSALLDVEAVALTSAQVAACRSPQEEPPGVPVGRSSW